MPHKRRIIKEYNSKQAIGWNQGTGAFGRSASQYLTFENKDSANNGAHDFTFNIALTRQGTQKNLNPTLNVAESGESGKDSHSKAGRNRLTNKLKRNKKLVTASTDI